MDFFIITIILSSLLLTLFILISTFWAIVFIKRIYYFRKYQIGAGRNMYDEEASFLNKQLYYHFETEIWKYFLLLMINLSEVIGGVFGFTLVTWQNYIVSRERNYTSTTFNTLDMCSNVNSTALNQFHYLQSTMAVLNGLGALGNSAELFVTAIGVCLMHYLIIRIKGLKRRYQTFNIRRYLLTTVVLSALIVCLGFIKLFSTVSKVLFLIIVTIYFCIFVKTSKKFKLALLQRAGERLAQHGSNKKEMQQVKFFKYTMNIVSSGFFLIIVSSSLLNFPAILTSALFYGKCYFPFNLMSPYKSIVQTEDTMETLVKVMRYIINTGRVLSSVGVFLLLSPLVFFTISIWINLIYRWIKGKSDVTRYNLATFENPPMENNK